MQELTSLPSPSVLVVDDQRAVRGFVERVLREGGYRVAVAENGSRAMDIISRVGRMDLVLADVVMPLLNGALFVRELLKRYPEQRVVYMSGQSVDVLARHNVADFELPFLAKPFTAEELLAKVEEELSRVRPRADQHRDP